MRLIGLITLCVTTSAFADTIVFNLGGATSILLPAGVNSKASGSSTLASIDHLSAGGTSLSTNLFSGSLSFLTGIRGLPEATTPTGTETLNNDPNSTWSIVGTGTIGSTSFTNAVLASGVFTPSTVVSHSGNRNSIESGLSVSYLAPGFLPAFGLSSWNPGSGALFVTRPGSFNPVTFAYTNSGTGISLGQLSFTASAVPEPVTESAIAAGLLLGCLALRRRTLVANN